MQIAFIPSHKPPLQASSSPIPVIPIRSINSLIPKLSLEVQGGLPYFSSLQVFTFAICNLCEFSPSVTILAPLWFIVTLLFSGFLQFKVNFVLGTKIAQNTVTELRFSIFVFLFQVSELETQLNQERNDHLLSLAEVREEGQRYLRGELRTE